jgi:fatty-acyl-CoA synthase
MEHQEFRHLIKAMVQKAASVDCEVVLAPSGSLTFTTSGKLSRAAAKARYLSGAISDVAAAGSDMEVFAVAS